MLSSLVRSSLFFAATLGAGVHAAQAAFLTELVLRGTTSGFYGALTQAFREVKPVWRGTVGAMVLLPFSTHLLEFVVHRLRGTERLSAGMAASIAFTVISTSFNLYAMRRGALVVGADSASLWSDLRRMPRLIAGFATHMFRGRAGIA